MREKDELQLIMRARLDEEAFEDLLKSYKSFISYILFKNYYLHSGGDYEDLLQEAKYGFYQAVLSFRPEFNKSFRNFASLCINRKLNSYLRGAKAGKHEVLNKAIPLLLPYSAEGTEIEIIIDTKTPEDHILEKEAFEALIYYLNTNLTEKEKHVLRLRVAKYSYEEIADELGTCKKSVDNAVQRIKNKVLRLKYLEKTG